VSNVTDKPHNSDDGTMPIDRPVDAPTDELPVASSAAESPASGSGGGAVPAVAGIVLCILWIMSIGLIVAQIVSAGRHDPGPGALAVGLHVAGALAGVACYRATSRHRGLPRLLGLLVILAITTALLWYFWWSPAR
jgi:hypothetical protein